MLDWNDLRYFLAVAREGSMLAAAKALKVNQSTVQRRLAVLEESIGGKLIERHPTGYRLTDLGQKMLAHAEGVEAAVATFERALKSTDTGLVGTIRVTCADGLAPVLVTPMLDAFRTRYPGLRVDLNISDRFLDLAKGEADIAVRAGEAQDSVLIGRKIADCAWAVYASRSYLERHGRPDRVADIARHAVIGFDGDIARIQAAQWLRRVASGASLVASCNTVTGLLLAVQSGIGLALLPAHMGDPQDDLVRLFEPVPDLTSPIYLLMHPDLRGTPRVRAFFDFVVAEIANFRPLLRGEGGRR